MPQGRPCTICADAKKITIACDMIAAGESDQAIANRIGVNRMAVSRHRHNHVIAPTQALVKAARKGKDVAAKRTKMIAATEAGDPAAFLELSAIVGDVKRVHERLERSAEGAEGARQHLAVSALSGQQLRAAEVRAKLGGVGGYAPGKPGPETNPGGGFSVNIYLGNERVERITTVVNGPVIEAGRD